MSCVSTLGSNLVVMSEKVEEPLGDDSLLRKWVPGHGP